MFRKKVDVKKLPQTLFAIVFILFIAATGIITLKKYWDIRLNGIEETADGYRQENHFSENFNILLWGKKEYVEGYGLISRLLHRPELNQVYMMKNGYLTSVTEKVDVDRIQQNAENMKVLNEYLEERGIELLYVQTPFKISKYDSKLPTGILDYSNENMDIFLQELKNHNIDVIDIREEMKSDGMNQYDYFYKTDHHWTTEAGFYAFTKIEGYIREILGIKTAEEVTNIDNYHIDNYPKWYLGSNGQRVGVYYGGIDDFHVIVPDFPTSITNQFTGEVGDYETILIENSVLQEQHVATYDIAYGNSIGSKFYNENASNSAKVLIVSDSMGKVVAPFVILGYQNVYTMGFSLTKDIIDEYQPDIIVYIAYHGKIGEDAFQCGITTQ